MRTNLKQARLDKGMTQQQVADYLDIGVRYYQKIESGDRTGDIRLWDDLEDLFSIHQKMLRQTDQADSR